jgi:hypothetical protein
MFNTSCYDCGAFSLATIGQVAVFDSRHLNVDVDPVQQGSGDA